MGGISVRYALISACLILVAHAGEPALPVRNHNQPPDLQQIVQRAGLIFLGRVETIEWKYSPSGGAPDRVRITFTVLDGIRGARTGEQIEIVEWSGLWLPGQGRYRAGETLFLFFYPHSRLGLTSTVGGDAGRIEITPTQRVVLSPESRSTLLPRSLRLQKHRTTADAVREQRSTVYLQFAEIVRELAQSSVQTSTQNSVQAPQ